MIAISGRHIKNAMVERCRRNFTMPRRVVGLASARRKAGAHEWTVSAIRLPPTNNRRRSLTVQRPACRPRSRVLWPACRSLLRGLKSGAERAFELLLGPLDDVVELLVALRELRHHHRVDRLIVHLCTDLGAGRRTKHRRLLVAAWRVAVNHADRRFDRLPRLEVIHALERWQVIAD